MWSGPQRKQQCRDCNNATEQQDEERQMEQVPGNDMELSVIAVACRM